MGLRLCNHYSRPIWTSIAFYGEICQDPPPFEVMGWWRIEPGACALVYANDLADLNRFWYVFALSDDGTVWSGDFHRPVPFSVYHHCWGVLSSAEPVRDVGFFELDIGDNDGFTVNFVP